MADERHRLVVTGANGFIGGHLVRHFAARGWDVVALARTPPSETSPGWRHLRYTLEEALPVEAFAGAHALIHCAFARGALDLNVEAARRLLAASRRAGVRRNVFLSSLSAKEHASSAYGRQKLAIERLFDGAADTVLRPGLVLGDGGLFRSTVAHVRARRPIPLIGRGQQPLQVVALDDLTRAVETVIERELAGRFVLAHPEAVPYRAFYAKVAARLGVGPRFVWVPYHLVSAALGVAEWMGLRLPVDRDNLRGLRAMSWVDPHASLAHLGLRLRSFDDVLQEFAP